MKVIVLAFLALIIYYDVQGQDLFFAGRVRCLNKGIPNSSRGAGNIVVLPALLPSASTITDPDPQGGFYEIRTNVPFRTLMDRKVRFYIIYGNDRLKTLAFHQYVSKDQIDKNRSTDSKYFITIKDYRMAENCDSVELGSLKPLVIIDSLKKYQDKSKLEDSGTIAAPGILQLLMAFPVNAAPEDSISTNVVDVTDVSLPTIRSGRLLFNSLMAISGNMGFNLAPSRNRNEAVFWNPAAMTHMDNKLNVGAVTNYRNNFRLSAALKLRKKIAVGVGFIVAGQNEPRIVQYDTIEIKNKSNVIEHAYFLGLSYLIRKNVSVGVNAKSLHQRFKVPSEILVTTHYQFGLVKYREYKLFSDIVKTQKFDFDVSVNWWIKPYLTFGVNVMNIKNSKQFSSLTAAHLPPDYVKLRMYSMGLTYLYKRFNIGSDVLVWNGKIHLSSGLSFIPMNNGEITLGWSSHQDAYNISLRYGRFKLSYIEYNETQVNAVDRFIFKTPKIFGGFILDL